VSDPASGLELRFDSAYWVSGIRARDPETLAKVDVTSLALPRFEETLTRIDRMLDNVSAGRDLCGPNPEIQTGDHWHERAIEIERGAPLASADEVRALLDNVAAVTLDVARAGIAAAAEGTVVVSSDGATALTLRGLAPGRVVAMNGATQAADQDGVVTVELAGPEDVVTLLP
jgi:hypothetical protein